MPTNPVYADLITRINHLAIEWEHRLDLPGIDIVHRFLETYKDGNDHSTVAETDSEWQYRAGVIRWYLPVALRLSEHDLEVALVHEYVHVLIAPLEGVMPAKASDLCEYVVESIARALTATRSAA